MQYLRPFRARFLILLGTLILPTTLAAQPEGYYRFPSLRGDTLVFTAEGDLWKVGVEGGAASRLTSHQGPETDAAISPDGSQVAFTAAYDGAREVYVMPMSGGLPRRLTWDGEGSRVEGWTPDGKVLVASRHASTLPNEQLFVIDAKGGEAQLLPLAQASQGVITADGQHLVFTRFRFQGSHTKRYRGGTAQNLWRFDLGAGSADDGQQAEARPLTADYPGTSRSPHIWGERIVFGSDRDGTMNLWSMDLQGGDLQQHTRHRGWDVQTPTVDGGRAVYQLGADLHLVDLASGAQRKLHITLASDLDQRRQRWLDKPLEYLTAAHVAPDGERIVLTVRGQVFVVPVKQGRLVELGREEGVRYRSARFLGDGEQLVLLSDQSGEVEWWRLDARGLQQPEQLTDDGKVLRFDGQPSPDGRYLASVDRDHELWLLDLESGEHRRLEASPYFGFGGLAWSPDSRWLAYSMPSSDSLLQQIFLLEVESGRKVEVTSERFDSYSPAFSADGKFLYFLSDRDLRTLVPSPWGSHQPQPFLDRKTKIYLVALQAGQISPFAPHNELMPKEESEAAQEEKKDDAGGDGKSPPSTVVEAEGLASRLEEVPVPSGNYNSLSVTSEHLYWLARELDRERSNHLQSLPIRRHEAEVQTVVQSVDGYELSAQGNKLLLQKGEQLMVVDATGEAVEKPEEGKVDLSGWRFAFDPREEWRQMYVEAWRLFRDYFYDPGMHGVDWPAVRDKYLPLVDRITDREELSNVLAQMAGELSALHHFVRGGDRRRGPEQIEPASLGASLRADEEAGGYRVELVYRGDPDLPEQRSPLSQPSVAVSEGALITHVDGVAALDAPDLSSLLRHRAGQQVLLTVIDSESEQGREVIVQPLDPDDAEDLRYWHWEQERRERVEELGEGQIGYVHLQAMGGRNWAEWARGYFPVFQRAGLVIDVRHNRGGNIDSWVLGSLLRKPWMWWKARVGTTYHNMQFSFGGHLVVLVNEHTASDGEAFAEGFRRLGLGQVLGTRTWGGEIWLTSSNVLVDGGIASAAEFGVYGPEGEWLIEGHGVEPDIVVDNLPHATFHGEDAQLEAAVQLLLQRIREQPPERPAPPPYPDKSFAADGATP